MPFFTNIKILPDFTVLYVRVEAGAGAASFLPGVAVAS
jgi:hypothetical protein